MGPTNKPERRVSNDVDRVSFQQAETISSYFLVYLLDSMYCDLQSIPALALQAVDCRLSFVGHFGSH